MEDQASDEGVELAREVAELFHGVDGEAAESGAFGIGTERGREGCDCLRAIGSECVHADLEFADAGGTAPGAGEWRAWLRRDWMAAGGGARFRE